MTEKLNINGQSHHFFPTECVNAQTLTSAERKFTHGASPPLCEKSLGPAWFCFQGETETKMPSSCVSKYRCGCHAPGWLNGAHPSVEDGKVVRQIWSNWNFSCCHWSVNIQIASAKLWELRCLLP